MPNEKEQCVSCAYFNMKANTILVNCPNKATGEKFTSATSKGCDNYVERK